MWMSTLNTSGKGVLWIFQNVITVSRTVFEP